VAARASAFRLARVAACVVFLTATPLRYSVMKWGHGVTSVLSLADRLLPGHEIDAGTDFLQIPCFSLTTQAPCRLASRVPPRRSWTSSNSYCASVVLARSAVLMDCALLYPGGLAAEHSTSLMAERSGSSDRNATQPTNAASMDKNRLLIELSESPRSQFGKVEYEKQSKIQRVFSAIWGLEAQVSNGGFQQYFQSSDGEAAADAADALRTIRAIRTASIVGEAVRMFPGGPPPRNGVENCTTTSRTSRLTPTRTPSSSRGLSHELG
jgi:hypothetical protein